MIKKLSVILALGLSTLIHAQEENSSVTLCSVEHTDHPTKYAQPATSSALVQATKTLGKDMAVAGSFVGSYYVLSTLKAVLTGNLEEITVSSVGKVALQAVALGASKWLITTGYNKVQKLVSDQK